MIIRAHIKIYGKVQGVFFRARAVEKANKLGDITGWVGNNADGTVEIVAEGPENKLNDFVDWCRSGPSTSEVTKIEADKFMYTGEFEDFDIRY
ncbi:acylphosphatase [Candidatus Peregrinibacteria bacterium]|nr:acylphosphatase [Candidatus Peregrinibacteria bacterium]